ncbi:MAG: TonB family protein [Acidobacteriaceae bacterium]|nr:TonB family protein [Acidobacteriaceae bacterium]
MPQDLLPPELNPSQPAPPTHAVSQAPTLSEVKESGPFASLISNLRDAFFPEKLPPLVLESKPIAVPDRMRTKMSKQSLAASITFYALLILLFIILVRKHVQLAAPIPPQVTQLIAPPPPPPPAPPKATQMGGGGGQKGPTPVTQGHLPKLDTKQIMPPKAPPTEAPKLAVEPTVVVQPNLKLADSKLPDLGAPNSNLKGFSLGNGSGTGIGSGNGSGIGPGSGGNMGGGVYRIGGSVRAPVLTFQVDPEFSEEARKAKFSGNVLVGLIIDEQGHPQNVHVIRDVGMGLGAKAVEAVKQYKFRPATKDGKPVKVQLSIEVNFQIF